MTENETVWTVETYAAHNEAMRVVEDRFQTERDRRYTEVNVEKEKALKIKETADLTALELARESQVYKDERNDAMREQNLKDNGIYATRDDLAEVVTRIDKTLKPLLDYVSSQQGMGKGSQLTKGNLYAAGTIIIAIIGAIVLIGNTFFK